MKKFIAGLIVGALLFSITSAAIEEYICYKADYKVMINGIEYTNPDLPILNHKGNTYAPFRSILEAAGLNVNWNAELNQAEVTLKTENLPLIKRIDHIPIDIETDQPIGAEFVDYKGCKALKYNEKIFVSSDDLYKVFGIKIKYIITGENKTVYEKDDKKVIIDKSLTDNFIEFTGNVYYKIDMYKELIGE